MRGVDRSSEIDQKRTLEKRSIFDQKSSSELNQKMKSDNN